MMAAGLLGALVNKLRTGQGDKVVVNLYHSAIWGGSIGLCAQQFGADYPKSRTDVPNPFNNMYCCADGKWVCVCLPEYDRDRVHVSDMKKCFAWFNILIGAGFTEFRLPAEEE